MDMRWANFEVRRLLRLLRRPISLERERRAIILREVSKATSARSAVLEIVEHAFDPSNALDRLRLEIIRRCDICGESTHEAAMALNLSERQFFRRRAEAIAAIARSMEQKLSASSNGHSYRSRLAQTIEMIDPKSAHEIYRRIPANGNGDLTYHIVRTAVWAGNDVTQAQIDGCEGPWRLLAMAVVVRRLISCGHDSGAARLRERLRDELRERTGPDYDVAAFELALLDRLDAARRGDYAECRSLLERLRRYAGENKTFVALTMLIEFDDAMIHGDVTAAQMMLDEVERLNADVDDPNVLARTALGEAMLAHIQGSHQDALVLANGAAQPLATFEGSFSWWAAAMAGRAALLCGERWSPPSTLVKRFPDVWSRALAEGVGARHLLRSDARASQRAAELALSLARSHDSPVYGLYAQVSLAGALDAQGQADRAQELRVAAWQAAVRLDARFFLYDLFHNPAATMHEIGPMRTDELFLSAVLRYLEDEVDAYATLRARVHAHLASELARHCLDRALGTTGHSMRTDFPARPLRKAMSNQSLDVRKLRALCDAIGRMVARPISYCVPPHIRSQFEDRFVRRWNAAAEEMASFIFSPDPDEKPCSKAG